MKRSDIFWASMLALGLIILYAFIDPILFIVLWVVFGGVIAVFGGILHAKDQRIPLWALLFPMTWLLIILEKLARLVNLFHQKVIVPFNKKLNGEK